MTSAGAYLVIETSQGSYAVRADQVLEITWLPALADPPTDDPGHVGTADLRGRTIPVLDLDLVLGRDPNPYGLDHQLVALSAQGGPIGIVVRRARDVVDVPDEQVDDDWDEQGPVAAMARLDDGPAGILDPEKLGTGSTARGGASPTFSELTSELDEADVDELERRRQELTTRATEEHAGGRPRTLAVVGLADELVAIPLETAREFLHVDELTEVPSTPDHVLGVTNHRGELVPVVDVTHRPGTQGTLASPTGPVVIVELDTGATGIALDRVEETITLTGDDIETPAGGCDHVEGTASHRGRTVLLVDPVAVLEHPAITVEQEV